MTFCPAIVKWYYRVNLAYYIEHEQLVIKSTERKMLFSCKKLLTILLGHEGYTRFDSLIAYKKKQQENTEKLITSPHFILSSYSTISTLLTWQYAGRMSNMNLVYGLALHEFSVTQRIECPPGVWEVIGSNPVLSCWLFHFQKKAQVKTINFFHSSWRQ